MFMYCRHWQEVEWLFNGHVWMYIEQAWAARHDPDVLLVFYEDLKDDAEAQVRRIAYHMVGRCRLTLLSLTPD